MWPGPWEHKLRQPLKVASLDVAELTQFSAKRVISRRCGRRRRTFKYRDQRGSDCCAHAESEPNPAAPPSSAMKLRRLKGVALRSTSTIQHIVQ